MLFRLPWQRLVQYNYPFHECGILLLVIQIYILIWGGLPYIELYIDVSVKPSSGIYVSAWRFKWVLRVWIHM